MFRYVLQVAFIRRVLKFRFIRFTLMMVFAGALIAGLIYVSIVFHALIERNSAPHVQHNSSQ